MAGNCLYKLGLTPRINASWFSTILADALEYGIIPVTLCTDDDRDVADIIYPLIQRRQRWPQDAEFIERLLDDKYHVSVLSRLREGLNGVGA